MTTMTKEIDKYTIDDARAEVGDSLDWELARKVSLKKWRQIESGDEESYTHRENCGYCFVSDNHFDSDRCLNCPTDGICRHVIDAWSPAQIIEAIEAIEHPKEVTP